MNELGESIGTAIEGGLVGRAVEPGHGEAVGDGATTGQCANCNTLFSGNYCQNCGQRAHIHRSLAAISHDIMHGVLHLDGKLWDTLPLLAFKPGALTCRYIAGERAKFVSPMTMFLFSVFAMFAVFQVIGISVPSEIPQNALGTQTDAVFRTNVQQQVAALEKLRETLPKDSDQRAEIGDELIGLNRLLELDAVEITSESDEINVTGISWLDDGIIKKWQQNPGLMLYKLQSNSYKFSWLLIPLSVPFVWLMFAWRRKFKAYDHAVFVTYSLSFMSLLFIATSIISTLPNGTSWALGLLAITAPLHLYKQLRHAYDLSRFSALWRFIVLTFSTLVVLVLFLQALLVLGSF